MIDGAFWSVGMQHHHSPTTVTTNRLEHGGAVLLAERRQLVGVGGDDHRGCDLGKPADVELFVRIPKTAGGVDHQRVVDQVVEKQGEMKVGGVEGRIGSDQHCVDGGQIQPLGGIESKREGGALVGLGPAGPGPNPPLIQFDVAGLAMPCAVLSLLGRQYERVGGVGFWVDGLRPVHDHHDVHG